MELIPIVREEFGSGEEQAVDARTLHTHLGVGRVFQTWFKDRVEKYDFVEGVDFVKAQVTTAHQNGEASWGGLNRIDYVITLDMAKELSMVENNEQGRQARKYFIEAEKQARKPAELSRMDILQLALESEKKLLETAAANERLNAQVVALRPMAALASTMVASSHSTPRQTWSRQFCDAARKGLQMQVKTNEVMDALGCLGLFVRGKRADHGQATKWAVDNGYAENDRGVYETPTGPRAYCTGKLTSRGQEYAHKRLYNQLEKTGHLITTKESSAS